MFAWNVYNLVKHLVREDGKLWLDPADPIDTSIQVTDGAQIVHKGALEAMGL